MDYTKSTNFASKDSLASGNPLKIVKGTEIDTEFNNIATAISTKADLSSPALVGTPTAPTASAGTNTTQLATTAFVTSAVATSASTAASTYAPLASPSLTGVPTAPTAALGANTTQLATTAFVNSTVTALGTMSTQNAYNVNITGGTISGLSGLWVSGEIFASAAIATSGVMVPTSPGSGSSGALVLRDAPGNPNAVYIQAANNAWSAQYGWLKFNSDGTLTPSGVINGNIAGYASLALGVGQNYSDVSGSRSIGVTYTNSTNKPIWVAVAWTAIGSGSYTAYVDGNLAYYTVPDTYPRANVNFIVPSGSTYSVNSSAGQSFAYWLELR